MSRDRSPDRRTPRAKAPVTALGVVEPPPLQVRAVAFEGSLAALFECVRERRVDLRDIPLAPICEAYFEYLVRGPASQLEEAAAALVALAYLLERKAWGLLPNAEPEPENLEPPASIPATIDTYADAVEALRLWHAERRRLFFRSLDAGPAVYELPYGLDDVAPGDLALAFERLLERAAPPDGPALAERRSLAEVIAQVLLAVSDTWRPLEKLLPSPYTRADAVYAFLALLELIRLGRVAVAAFEEGVRFARAAESPAA